MKKYSGTPKLYRKELQKTFKESDFVFVQDMSDLFGAWISKEIIQQVLNYIKNSEATFLLLTKNPKRYLEFDIPDNCICGTTIETDLGFRDDRFNAMIQLQHPRRMISIEPIMQFSNNFETLLLACEPEFVAIGYDNYNNQLDEPYLKDTEFLISGLEQCGIKVYRKTLRKAWYEK